MTLFQKGSAEFLGTCGLLMVIVGSGIMAENLSQGNLAIALIANSIATGAGLFALIQSFGFISGAQFNPVVSVLAFFSKQISMLELAVYSLAQIAGGITGVFLSHYIFNLPILQLSSNTRTGLPLLLSETIATFGLILVIRLTSIHSPKSTAMSTTLYIVSAYWFTSSTSFANPAVTIARSFSNTFSGILLSDVPGFIFAQFVGGFLALLFVKSVEKSLNTRLHNRSQS